METSGFDLVRQKFVAIGVIGQTFSGQSSFFNYILSKNHFGIRDHVGVYEDCLEAALDGDPEILSLFTAYDLVLPNRVNEQLSYDLNNHKNVFNSDSFLSDQNNMHKVRHCSLKKKISRLSTGLKTIVEKHSNITKDMNFPVFIDLTMVGDVDYYQLVDHLLVIKRPTIFDKDAWYVKQMLSCQENVDVVDLCFTLDSAEKILAADDTEFSKISIDPLRSTVIENYGSLTEFENKIIDILNNYSDKTLSNLASKIEELSKGI